MLCDQIEVSLSGFIDGELPQQQSQMIARHLETCERCAALVAELRAVRERTARMDIDKPTGNEWKKVEKNIFQSMSRNLGWAIVIVWSAVTAGYALFQLAISPTEPLFEKILVFGLFLGFGLLFLSVLSERVRESKTDRYKGVQR